jgi:adenine-specific DNA-methyltransferase
VGFVFDGGKGLSTQDQQYDPTQRCSLICANAGRTCSAPVSKCCSINYEADTTEFTRLDRIPMLKARMRADLHIAGDLKNTGKGNLFVIFDVREIDLIREKDGRYRVKVKASTCSSPRPARMR